MRTLNDSILPGIMLVVLLGCEVPKEFLKETPTENPDPPVCNDLDDDGLGAPTAEGCATTEIDPCPFDNTNTCNDDDSPPAPPAADADEDGTPDGEDNCPNIFNENQRDTDLDTIGDLCDNCIETANRNQEDNNGDGTGDACPPSFVVFILLTCEAADDPLAPEIRIDCNARTTGDDGSQPRAVTSFLFELEKRGDPVGVEERTQEGNVSLFPPKEIACDGNDGNVFGVRMTATLASGVDHVYVSNNNDGFIVETETGLKIPDSLCP